GETEHVSIGTDMLVDHKAERQYIYDHAWRQVKEKHYDPDLQGVDWEMYGEEYAKFLPYINNNYDFQVLLSELLGELNVSHTGGRYTPKSDNEEKTASLGLLYDQTYMDEGIKVAEVIRGGPLDKADSDVKK